MPKGSVRLRRWAGLLAGVGLTLATCVVAGMPAASPASARTGVAVNAAPAAIRGGWPTSRPVRCPAASVRVGSATQLTAALASARAGSVIELADGVYLGHFTIARSGTAGRPAWLCGGPHAVLDGGRITSGYTLHLTGADQWRLVGFAVRHGQKGIVVDHGAGNVLQRLAVSFVGDEGIHLRAASAGNVIRDSTISHSGLHNPKFGEGIYVGSAISNWCSYSGCRPDRSDSNQIIGNRFAATSAENLDIKEGTTHGLVQANRFSGLGGLTAADSWVDVKGHGWLVVGNVGSRSPRDGFQTHQVAPGWGTANVFRANVAHVDGAGYGTHLAPPLDNVVACDNVTTGAALGATSSHCR
jgi:hypothetical protein